MCMPVIDRLLFGNSNRPGVREGSIMANHGAGAKLRPCSAQPEQETNSRCKPWRKVSSSVQHSALTRTRPLLPRSLPAQWTFFRARGRGGEGWILEVGELMGAWTKVDIGQMFSSTWTGVTLDWFQTVRHDDGRKKTLIYILLMHTCASFAKHVIAFNLQSQITCRVGWDTSKQVGVEKKKHSKSGWRKTATNLRL